MSTPLFQLQKDVSQSNALSRYWGDCGNTANAVVQALRTGGFTVTATPRQSFPTTGQSAVNGGVALTNLLLGQVHDVTLFNVDLDGVHIFVLEKHPDGTSLLSQGYRGTYFPWWWQGLTRTSLPQNVQSQLGATIAQTVLESEQTDAPNGRDATSVNPVRATYGLGQNLGVHLTTLAQNLGRLVALDYWGGVRGVPREETVSIWQDLPFAPADTTVIGRSGRAGEEDRNPIKLTADVYTITGLPGGSIPTAIAALGGTGEQFLTQVVIRSAKAQIDRARYGAQVASVLP